MYLISYVPCFISLFLKVSEIFQFKKSYTDLILVLCTGHMHDKAMLYFICFVSRITQIYVACKQRTSGETIMNG